MAEGVSIGATIESRMTSSRFHGKVMEPILGIPLLEHLVSRVRASTKIQHITIATTTNASDDVIEQLARRIGVSVFRGSEHDVLGRIVGAATEAGYEVLVRLTGDNPLYCPELIDAMLEFYLENDYDLVANAAMSHVEQWNERRSFPLGLGIQIVRTCILKRIERTHHDLSSREHVTLPILTRPDAYKLGAFHARGRFKKFNRPHYRLTVDTREDFHLMTEIFKELYPKKRNFPLSSVIELLDSRPELVEINAGVKQKKPAKTTDSNSAFSPR